MCTFGAKIARMSVKNTKNGESKMKEYKVPIQSLIDHIKTAIDVDPWAKAMVEDMAKRLEEQEWNLLTEDDEGFIHGLPGDDGQYLMTDGRVIWIDDFIDGVDDGVSLDSGRDVREIKAWMYMPKLPEKKKENDTLS
jgi:hypothetical protein